MALALQLNVHMRRRNLVAVAVLTILSNACGSKDNPPVPQTITTPTAPSEPTSAPGSTARWTQIYEVQNNDIVVVGGKCNWPHKFTVNSNGSYSGSCTGGLPPISGTLTSTEFNELSTRATKVAEADPSLAATCDPALAPIAGSSVDQSLDTGATYAVLNSTPTGTCFRGGKANVLALTSSLGKLMEKYFPKA
jgi:hypothetical protein